jgi:hypothetical protein
MCKCCTNTKPLNYLLECKSCKIITNELLNSYVKEHVVKELYCMNTNITEIPSIEGLKKLNLIHKLIH